MTNSTKRPKKVSSHVDTLRGTSRLAIEATQAVLDLVEAMNETIASGPAILGRPLRGPVLAINSIIYGGLRTMTKFVSAGIDSALAQLAQRLGTGERVAASVPEQAALAVLNGVLGDYLQETNNPLAIPMQLRSGRTPLLLEQNALREMLPQAGSKLLILIHGSCLDDRQWLRQGHDHGAELARELGYTPVYLNYNTGLHISTNGRALAALLDELATAWPAPLEEIVMLGHSMGGLVARSACHLAKEQDYLWQKKLRKMIFLGSPHQGAPLERWGNWMDQLLVVSRYSAPLARLGKIRSAGVTDLRHGNVLDEHWQGHDRFAGGTRTRVLLPLPEDVACYAIAASNDGIVPVDSALGLHKRSELILDFPRTHQWIGYGMGHLDLLSHSEVYSVIRQWLSGRCA